MGAEDFADDDRVWLNASGAEPWTVKTPFLPVDEEAERAHGVHPAGDGVVANLGTRQPSKGRLSGR